MQLFIKVMSVLLIINCLLSPSLAVVDDPGSRGVDWDQVRAKIDKYKWARDIYAQMQKDVAETQKLFPAPPLGTTGWLHEYYCDDDAARLIFDPKKPNEHVCSRCGKVYTGSPYDDVWRSSVHSKIAGAAVDSAILYQITKDEKYLEYPRSILLWYADNFDRFKPHGRHAGKGIIREQSLDEATHLIRMVTAYWDICSALDESERNLIAEKFLIPDAEFIQSQTRVIHNIHSWHNAAVGMVGMATGNKYFTDMALNGPLGLTQQIQKGIKQDGFWYEGSISYHYYTISSIQPLYIAAKAGGILPKGTDKFKLMYSVPVEFSFDDGQFPANNDGWSGMNIKDLYSYYEAAAALWPDEFSHILSMIYENGHRSGQNALLYGPVHLEEAKAVAGKSSFFDDSGIAILRNDSVNVYIKYGPYGGGHDHNDRLNIILYAGGKVIVPDLGTSGYGISLNKWFRSPAAHNLLVVDGKRQANCGGYCISHDSKSIHAGVKDAYPGVDIKRKITLTGKGFSEQVTAGSESEHTYDLFYHVRGSVDKCSAPLESFEGKLTRNGYEYLTDIRHARVTDDLEIRFQLRDVNGSLSFRSSAKDFFDVFVAACPDNPADEKMSVIILRRKNLSAAWENNLQVDLE